MPSSGQSTRLGLESPTSRSPSGPGTVRVMRSDAMPRLERSSRATPPGTPPSLLAAASARETAGASRARAGMTTVGSPSRTSAGVDIREVAVPAAQHDRHEIDRDLVDQPGRERLPGDRAGGDADRSVARRSPCARAIAASMPSVTKWALPVSACAQSVGGLVGEHDERHAQRMLALPAVGDVEEQCARRRGSRSR